MKSSFSPNLWMYLILLLDELLQVIASQVGSSPWGQVDVGHIEYRSRQPDGSQPRKQLEVDFVVNMGSQRTYYQSAYTLYDDEQINRENRPMLLIHDSFRKVLLTYDVDMPWNDEDGILHLGLFNFLFEQ